MRGRFAQRRFKSCVFRKLFSSPIFEIFRRGALKSGAIFLSANFIEREVDCGGQVFRTAGSYHPLQ